MKCPVCEGPVLATSGEGSGVQEIPGWRCQHCNVKFVVTNPVALPNEVWRTHPTCRRRAIAWRKKIEADERRQKKL